MRFVAGKGVPSGKLAGRGAVTELLLAGAAVAETLTPDEVCCWQDSRWEIHREAKSGSRRGDYFKNLLPFEIFILNCRLEFSKNLKR